MYLACKVESRELVSPVFFCFWFLVDSIRFDSFVSFLPNFFSLVFVFVLFRQGEVECGSDLTSYLFLPFLTLHCFTSKVQVLRRYLT